MTSPAARFAAVFAVLYAAHEVGDQWVQYHEDAAHKQDQTAAGQHACARHVATYTTTTALAVGVANATLRLGLTWRGLIVGQAVSAATHYIVDRGLPLRRIASKIDKGGYIDKITVVRQPGAEMSAVGPGTGAYALDQSWHIGWLAVAALATAIL